MDENRKYKRYNVDSTVFFLNNITESVDLSVGGVQIKSTEEIGCRDTLSLCILLHDNEFVHAYGDIVWDAMDLDADYTYGIQFKDISDSDMEILSDNLY